MEKLLKIPYKVFNDWDQLQLFLKHKGNPRYELVGDVDLFNRKDIFDLGNLVRVDGYLILNGTRIQSLGKLEYVGDFDLRWSSIKSLGNLVRVDDNLKLGFSPIRSLGTLEYVGGYLDLENTPIKSLGNLKFIGRYLDLLRTPIKSLGNLEYVGEEILLSRYHQIPEKQLNKFNFRYL